MTRKFAIVEKYQDAGLNLPVRATTKAAGYDFEAAEDFVVPSIWKRPLMHAMKLVRQNRTLIDTEANEAQSALNPVLIPTGIKAYMPENEFLMIANRSSNPLKRRLLVPNGIGVIDADYVDNPKNEGEIFIQMTNFGILDIKIKKGERIAQGIFMPFLVTDDDMNDKKTERVGGFGSSGQA